MTWTTPQDIIDRWFPENEAPTNQALLQIFIGDVEAAIKSFYPKIQERIDDGLLDIVLIKSTVSQIITDYIKSGGVPYSQLSQTNGPFTQYAGYSSETRRNLRVTLADVSALAPTGTAGVVMVTTAPRPTPRNSNGWEDDIFYTRIGYPNW